MKKLIVIFLVMFLVSALVNAQTSVKNDVFVFPNLLDVDNNYYVVAKVWRDKVQFFIRPIIGGAKWVAFPELDFILPENFDYIFSIDNYLCVVIKNIVHTYQFLDKQWQEMPEYQFTIPIKYDHLFFCSYYLCIVADKKIRFFEFDDNARLIENTDMAFVLLNGYDIVYSSNKWLGLVINDGIRFYEYNNKWAENPNMSITLPDGSKKIILLDLSVFGVVFDTGILFYMRADKWIPFILLNYFD